MIPPGTYFPLLSIQCHDRAESNVTLNAKAKLPIAGLLMPSSTQLFRDLGGGFGGGGGGGEEE